MALKHVPSDARFSTSKVATVFSLIAVSGSANTGTYAAPFLPTFSSFHQVLPRPGDATIRNDVYSSSSLVTPTPCGRP